MDLKVGAWIGVPGILVVDPYPPEKGSSLPLPLSQLSKCLLHLSYLPPFLSGHFSSSVTETALPLITSQFAYTDSDSVDPHLFSGRKPSSVRSHIPRVSLVHVIPFLRSSPGPSPEQSSLSEDPSVRSVDRSDDSEGFSPSHDPRPLGPFLPYPTPIYFSLSTGPSRRPIRTLVLQK